MGLFNASLWFNHRICHLFLFLANIQNILSNHLCIDDDDDDNDECVGGSGGVVTYYASAETYKDDSDINDINFNSQYRLYNIYIILSLPLCIEEN